MEYVERARAASERGEVVLRERLDATLPAGSPALLELRVNGVFVMDSEHTDTEVLLARTALAMVDEPGAVLIGGLGLGCTVRAVLADPRVGSVRVAEIEEALVGWFRDGTIADGPALLADPRLQVSIGDVRTTVAGSVPGSVDVVLLDVDNGPDFLVYSDNAQLYTTGFLVQVRHSLRVGGAVCVWSSSESPRLVAALQEVFGNSGTRPCPVVLQGREHTYWLHSARRT